jgi:hypothetical protein
MSAVVNSSTGPSGNVRVVNPLELAGWDDSIRGLPGVRFFHTQAWTRVLHETYGYQPCYHALVVSGQIRALLPLMQVDSWATGRRGIALPFTDNIEPLCANHQHFGELFSSVTAFARSHRWKYLELRGGKKWLPTAPCSTSFFHHTLDLSPDEQTLFANCDGSIRRAVRKAEREEVQVEFSQSMESMREFYSLLCLTRRRHGVPPQPFSFFANIQRHVLQPGQGWVVVARKGPLPIAAGVFFHFGKEAIYKFGASDETHQRLRANNLVMWRAIQRYYAEGAQKLDFGRTSLFNDGLRIFKRNWGTEEGEIGYIRLGARGDFAIAPDMAGGWHNAIFRCLPSPISRLAGALLYRHIA